MNLDELLLNINDVSFETAVCQSSIQTDSDKESYRKRRYNISLTETEFKEKFPEIDPGCIYYIPSISMDCFYFNKETLAACPFHMDFMLAGFDGPTADGARKAFAKREAEVAEGAYRGSISILPDRMKLEYFTLLIEKKGQDIPDLYKLFLDTYTNSDYGFAGMDKKTLTTILSSKTKEDQERTNAILQDFPDTVTIYRGGNSASADYREAYSWTLDINTANFFASRRGMDTGYIVEAQVNKADIIDAFLDDRDEQEIVVDPANLRIINEAPVHGLGLLKTVLPKVTPIYHEYMDEMDYLDFAMDSDYHGKPHQARVLLLTQIISELMDLPLYERRLLAAAAIYHDTKRVHDDDDEVHGTLAAEYYHGNEENPSPIVEFLCKYHCLPDEQGYAEIKANKKLRRNQSMVTRLYQIIKDADALDRVRFEIKDLDLNQLRLPVSKELTLVARICLEQVKA